MEQEFKSCVASEKGPINPGFHMTQDGGPDGGPPLSAGTKIKASSMGLTQYMK